MKQLYLIILIVFAASFATAQPIASYDREMHDFGSILWKNPVGVTFTVTNKGNQPLVITNVTTSCGCTAVDWTKTIIPSGESGTITATFDAMQLGKFNKSIGVYSNAGDIPTYLSLKGTVTTQIENYDEVFPHIIGNLRLDDITADFGDVYRGKEATIEIGIINLGDTEYIPSLMHLPNYLQAEFLPSKLKSKESGKIRLTLQTQKVKRNGWLQSTIYLARYPGDRVSEENDLNILATLLPEPAKYSTALKRLAPALQLSEKKIVFEPFGEKKKLTHTLTLTNTGKSTLKIDELQVSDWSISVDLKKNALQPGEATKLKIKAIAKNLKKSNINPQVLLITNDPNQPKVIVEVNIKK